MANSYYNQYTFRSGDPGTLSSRGLYDPSVPSGQNLPGGQRVSGGLAYTRNVNPNELTSNQLTGLLSRNNPYIANARQRGVEYGISRGLGNSSIAAGAAERSAIESALPIAESDAGAYRTAASENLGYMNESQMQARDLKNQALIANLQAGVASGGHQAQLEAARLAQQGQLQRQREALAFEGEQAGLGRAFEYGMSNLGYQQGLGAMGYEYGLRNQLATNDAFRQDWLGNQDFGRSMYAFGAAQRAANSSALFQNVANYALQNPEIMDMEAASGFYNFFNSPAFDDGLDEVFNFGGWF